MTAPTWHEVPHAHYDEMLGVLPPALWLSYGFMVGEASDHGGPDCAVRYAAYVRHTTAGSTQERYYAASRALTVAEFKAWRPSDLVDYTPRDKLDDLAGTHGWRHDGQGYTP